MPLRWDPLYTPIECYCSHWMKLRLQGAISPGRGQGPIFCASLVHKVFRCLLGATANSVLCIGSMQVGRGRFVLSQYYTENYFWETGDWPCFLLKDKPYVYWGWCNVIIDDITQVMLIVFYKCFRFCLKNKISISICFLISLGLYLVNITIFIYRTSSWWKHSDSLSSSPRGNRKDYWKKWKQKGDAIFPKAFKYKNIPMNNLLLFQC